MLDFGIHKRTGLIRASNLLSIAQNVRAENLIVYEKCTTASTIRSSKSRLLREDILQMIRVGTISLGEREVSNIRTRTARDACPL